MLPLLQLQQKKLTENCFACAAVQLESVFYSYTYYYGATNKREVGGGG